MPAPPSSPWRRLLPAFPSPHFMGLAPLDVWARVLGMAKWRVGWRYWPRLTFALFSSAISTVLTLPERLIVPRILSAKQSQAKGEDGAIKALVVLGYYRSGTTHLHYLLCCDKRFVTPRWYQALAPQGYVFSWAVLRWALIPFLAATRPQDDVAYGPEWPVEDDFAMCCAMGARVFGEGGGGSSLPGRFMFSEPETVKRFMRWHDLRTLSEQDRAGFRRTLKLFAEKVVRAEKLMRRLSVRGSHRRDAAPVLLLKTPSHTARVRELLNVFGEKNVQFVHLSREPDAVLRSNIAMHQRLEPHRLQDEPSPESIRDGIIEEYARTERCFLEDEPMLPTGNIARMRFDELTGDPIGSLKRVYASLGISWCDDAERRMHRYLDHVGEYRSGSARHTSPGDKLSVREPLPDEFAFMNEAFGHDGLQSPRPLVDSATERASACEGPDQTVAKRPLLVYIWLLSISCVVVASVLTVVGFMLRDRIDVLAWPMGIAIGTFTLRGVAEARLKGSRALGIAAGLLTIAVVLALALPLTWWEGYADRRGPIDWPAVWLSTTRGISAKSSLVWMALGAVSAYRIASRTHAMPPGDEL